MDLSKDLISKQKSTSFSPSSNCIDIKVLKEKQIQINLNQTKKFIYCNKIESEEEEFITFLIKNINIITKNRISFNNCKYKLVQIETINIIPGLIYILLMQANKTDLTIASTAIHLKHCNNTSQMIKLNEIDSLPTIKVNNQNKDLNIPISKTRNNLKSKKKL